MNELTIDCIKDIVSKYYLLMPGEIDTKSRKREIVQARQIAMFLSKSYTKSSVTVIGIQIGNKAHATVLHACKTVNNLIDTDKTLREDIKIIKSLLKQHKEKISYLQVYQRSMVKSILDEILTCSLKSIVDEKPLNMIADDDIIAVFAKYGINKDE